MEARILSRVCAVVLIALSACADTTGNAEDDVRIWLKADQYAVGDTMAIFMQNPGATTVVLSVCPPVGERRKDSGWEIVDDTDCSMVGLELAPSSVYAYEKVVPEHWTSGEYRLMASVSGSQHSRIWSRTFTVR